MDDPGHGFLWFLEGGCSGGIGLVELIFESFLTGFEFGDLRDHFSILSERGFQRSLELGIRRLILWVNDDKI